jgi:hypothetical protein
VPPEFSKSRIGQSGSWRKKCRLGSCGRLGNGGDRAIGAGQLVSFARLGEGSFDYCERERVYPFLVVDLSSGRQANVRKMAVLFANAVHSHR